jgi:hypothetical protein
MVTTPEAARIAIAHWQLNRPARLLPARMTQPGHRAIIT